MSRLVCILNRSVRKWSESCWVAILSNTSCCSVVTSKSSLVSTKTKQRQSFRNKLLLSLPELQSDFDEENVAAVVEAISSHQAHGSSCARTICLFNLSVVEVNFLSKLKMGYTVHSIVMYSIESNVSQKCSNFPLSIGKVQALAVLEILGMASRHPPKKLN